VKIIATIAELRRALRGRTVACVPTMGNLHEGHLGLMRVAQRHGDCTVATIFVNRLQFAPHEDFDTYPRTFAADCAQLERAGVDVVFAPDEREMYPVAQGYKVAPPPELGDILEGEFRRGFFNGVCTVVLKLFNVVQPQAAVFGKKDYQQLRVIQGMVAQLALPIAIVPGETARTDDGLALSSRNNYLSPAERAQAPRLHRTLAATAQSIAAGARDYGRLEQDAMDALRRSAWAPDYVAVRRQADLQPPAPGDRDLVVLAAARLGGTRLIDNIEVSA